MRKLIPVLFAFALFACQPDGNNPELPYENEEFVTDSIPIFNYFDAESFENDTLPKLLDEIGFCASQINGPNPCTPRNYKFFKYKENMSWNDGFGLEIRATVDSFPLRRFILFERVDGVLAKSRGFVANLAELHSTPSGYYDLMLLFPDPEAGSFVAKFIYDTEEKNYVYKSLEAIDGYPVKAERKDSLSNVVLKRLTNNNMFF
jgi:hypothetical protein